MYKHGVEIQATCIVENKASKVMKYAQMPKATYHMAPSDTNDYKNSYSFSALHREMAN